MNKHHEQKTEHYEQDTHAKHRFWLNTIVSDHLALLSLGAIWRANMPGKWAPYVAESSRDTDPQLSAMGNPAVTTRRLSVTLKIAKRTCKFSNFIMNNPPLEPFKKRQMIGRHSIDQEASAHCPSSCCKLIGNEEFLNLQNEKIEVASFKVANAKMNLYFIQIIVTLIYESRLLF